MSKIDKQAAYTKGAKKRAKKARKAMEDACALEPITKRQPNGQKRRNPDPQGVARRNRERKTGKEGKDALSPDLGTDMGCCIDRLASAREHQALVDAWEDLSAAHRNFRLRIIGQTGDPKGAAVEMIHDAMETDPSLRVDLRAAEERDAAAKHRWMEWEARIKALPTPQHKWAIRGALDGFMGEGKLWRGQDPTPTGRVAVDALRKMCDGA